MDESDLTVEGLMTGHLSRLLSIVTAGGDDDVWQRRISTGVLAFQGLVSGLSGVDLVAPEGMDSDDPDTAVPACLAALQEATATAAEAGLIPSRRLFVEDVTDLLEAVRGARGVA